MSPRSTHAIFGVSLGIAIQWRGRGLMHKGVQKSVIQWRRQRKTHAILGESEYTVMTGSPCWSGTKQRWFGGQRDLDYSTPRVWWLHTLLHRKAKAQGTRPSKPKKKGTCLIGNSRGIAARVQVTSVGFGQGVGHLPVSITWVGPCQRQEDVDGSIKVVLDEKGQRWVSWGWVRDRTWTGSDYNEEYWRWYSD